MLTLLRLGVVGGVVVIMLNPHERTQRSATRPSRVAVAIDTSLSMQFPATDDDPQRSGATPTRAAAVREAFVESGLLRDLAARHNVSVYTFDSKLEGPHRSLLAAGSAATRPGRN